MKFIHDLVGFKVVDIWDMSSDRVMVKLVDNNGDNPDVLAEVVINSSENKIGVVAKRSFVKVVVDGQEVKQQPQGEGKVCVICEEEIKKGDGYRIDYLHSNCSSQKDSEVAQLFVSYLSGLNSYFGVNNLPKGLTKSFLTKLKALSMSHINLEHGTLNEDITRMLTLFWETEGEEC